MRRWGPIVSAMLLLTGCHSGIWHWEPELPPKGDPWELKLLDPLTTHNPYLWAHFRSGSEGDGEVVKRPALVDSGASGSHAPGDFPEELGLETHVRDRVKIVGASGLERSWTGVVVPEVRLGKLTVRDLVITTWGDDTPLVGRDVFRRPWEMDLARGRIVLGAPPWPESPDVHEVELGSYEERGHYLTVKLDGHEVRLVLDTGASYTSIEENFGKSLGLARRRLERSRKRHGANAEIHVHAVFEVERFEIGGVDVGPVPVEPLPRDRYADSVPRIAGLLGMDVLSRFRFRVAPGDRLQLRRRGPLLEHRRARIERWRWMPSCEQAPGCVTVEQADVPDDAGEGDVMLRLRMTGDVDRSAAYLFGCERRDGTIHEQMPYFEIAFSEAVAGEAPLIHLVHDEQDALGQVWMKHVEQQCGALTLLDVNPMYGWREDDAEERVYKFRFVTPPFTGG